MRIFSHLCYLNILTLAFSLPLVTLFPSLFALVQTMQDTLFNKPDTQISTAKRFKTHFVQHIKKSYQYAVIVFLIALVVISDFAIIRTMPQTPITLTLKYALIIFSILFFLVAAFTFYHYALKNTGLKQAWVLGFLVAIKNPGMSLLLLASCLLFIVVFLFQPGLGLLFLFSAPTYFLCIISQTITRQEPLYY